MSSSKKIRLSPFKKKQKIEKRKQINTSAMYSILSELLRSEDKYCDVNIKVGNEFFRSSRLFLAGLSEYFNTMFYGSTFAESNIISQNEPVVLRNLDSSAFENVLNFMYTGDVLINENNVCALLRTCDFLILRMPHVEERCVQYFETSVQPVSTALEIFTFASTRKKIDLIDALRGHIFKFLKYFSEDPTFMEISYDELSLLLKQKNLPNRDENRVLNTVIRWIHHVREERSVHREELMKMVNFVEVSARYVLFMLNEYENLIDRIMPKVTFDEKGVSDENIVFLGNNCPDLEDNRDETSSLEWRNSKLHSLLQQRELRRLMLEAVDSPPVGIYHSPIPLGIDFINDDSEDDS